MENNAGIISLYREEIETYKQQIDELKARNRSCDDKNAALINRVRDLEDLVEKARIANKDLNDAYEHVSEENMKLQVHRGDREPALPMIPEPEQELALETVERQFVNLARESVSWISDKDRMTQRIKFLERECDRYNRDCTTLGKQVRHLLRTLEEERGMIIRRQAQVSEDQQITCAADVIDKHLITFESIEELQQQNQKLTSIVKEMSAREEQRETQLETEEIRKLNQELETLKGQLESVKSDRENILNAFNTIHREKNLFKILLTKTRQVEHLTPEIFQRMVSVAVSSGPAITDTAEDSVDKDAHINELKSMISKLEQELTDLRAYVEEIRTRGDEELKLKAELLEKAHMKILEEVKRADVLNERNQVLETNLNTITAEYEEIRTKCQKLSFEAEQTKSMNDELTVLRNYLEQILKRGAEDLVAKDAHINELKTMISRLEQELTDLRAYLEEIRTRGDDELKLKADQLEKAHAKILEEIKRADSLNERNKLLETKLQTMTSEYADIRTKYQQLSVDAKQSKPVNTMPSDYEEIRTRCQKLSFEAEQMRVAKIPELERQLSRAQSDIVEFQELRNLERAARLRLAKVVALRRTRPLQRRIKTPRRRLMPATVVASQEMVLEVPAQQMEHETCVQQIDELISQKMAHEAPNQQFVEDAPDEQVVEIAPPPHQFVEETPNQLFINDTSNQQLIDDTPNQQLIDDTPNQQLVEEVPDQLMAEETPAQQFLEPAPDREMVEVAPDEQTAGLASDQPVVEEAAGQQFAEEVAHEKVVIKLKRRNLE